jgi:hypothetical protein
VGGIGCVVTNLSGNFRTKRVSVASISFGRQDREPVMFQAPKAQQMKLQFSLPLR